MSEAFNGDVCVYCETVGPPDWPLVILVAGLGEQIGSVEFSDEQAERFVQAGLRVARLDNRDAGLSTSFDGAGRPVLDDLFAAVFAGETVAVPCSHADMAGDIVAMADALHATEFHLVGASLGGFLVRWTAVRHPDRVASLTVVMSGAGAYPGEDAPQLEMSTISDLVTEAEHRPLTQRGFVLGARVDDRMPALRAAWG